MSGFAKLTGKALRALAEEYEVQLPAGRITKNGLIKILQSENIQPPWDGPEWECPVSSSLAGLSGSLGIRIGRSLSSGSPAEEAVAFSDSPDHSGRSGDLGRIAGSREGRLAPSPLEERGSLASAGEPFLFGTIFRSFDMAG